MTGRGDAPADAPPGLSVVVPVYRTAWALPELARRVAEAACETGLDYELVLVDDASPDGVREVAGALAAADPAVRLITLEKNVGQHRAVLAGLRASRGEWVAVMDGDLQDPPEAIPGLLAEARRGYEAVFAARRGRYQARGRMATSRAFKRLLARICGLPPGAGMYFLASRRLVERIAACEARRPSVVALVGLAGLPLSALPVERAGRLQGSSAYSGGARLRAGLSALTFALGERRRSRRGPSPARPLLPAVAVAALLGVAATAVSFLLAWPRPLELGDESFGVLLSRDWARGENLYRLYRLHYVPGQYAWYGAAMRLLGEKLWVFRLAAALLTGAGIGFFSWVLLRIAPVAAAAAGALALAVSSTPRESTLAALLVVGLAVDLARRERPSRRWVLAVSALAGALLAWREDSAVLALVLAAVAVGGRRRPWEALTAVAPAATAGFLPWLGLALARGEAAELAAHVGRRLLFLGERLALPTRPGWRLPLDPLASPGALAQAFFPALAALPPLLYAALVVRELWRRRQGRKVRKPLLAAAVAGFAYLPQFLWERPDLTHLRYHMPVLMAVVAVWVGTAASETWRHRLGPALLAVYAVAFALALLHTVRLASPIVYPTPAGRALGARIAGAPPPWSGLAPRPGETLIVLGWGPGWHLLEGVPPGSRYLYSGERHLLSEGQLVELSADLARRSNRWVITRGQPGEPFAAILAAHYRSRPAWNLLVLWERTAAPRPP